MHLPRLLLLVALAAASSCTGTETHQALPKPVLGPQAPVVAVPVVTPTPKPASPALPAGCARTTTACVSTRDQVAWLQHDGRVTYGPVRVALGGPGHRTPKGTFHVAWKDDEHWSSTYGIPMPWSVFFAAGGVAFHQGPLDESSHGCVHLGPVAAQRFFAELHHGDRVQVI